MGPWLFYNAVVPLIPIGIVWLISWFLSTPTNPAATVFSIIKDGQVFFFCTALASAANWRFAGEGSSRVRPHLLGDGASVHNHRIGRRICSGSIREKYRESKSRRLEFRPSSVYHNSGGATFEVRGRAVVNSPQGNPERSDAIQRLVDDTFGATAGAAVGTVVSAAIGLAMPALFAIIPLGTIGASLAGVVYQEIARKKREGSVEKTIQTL